ncbi:MAG: hypothetical protein MAGBODY4_01141 [Candidatus Marinimicrobia bacterium]|nr:hypothetical protein [Candidatus Neomarinimicrobiota bacterium]
MKRHDALVSLSSDHHTGLLWARKLKDATPESAQSDPEQLAEEFLSEWYEDINPHFRREEEILLPYFAREGDFTHESIRKMLQQHIILRRDVAKLRENVTVNLLVKIGDTLHEHIRHEERTVFPLIEEQTSEKILQKIYAELDE